MVDEEGWLPADGSATVDEACADSSIEYSMSGELYETSEFPAEHLSYCIFKRAIEIFMILIAIPFLACLTGAIAFAIAIDSPGPIFFSHRRIGHKRSFFQMWKFRTMCNDSHAVLHKHLNDSIQARAEWHENRKLRHDPRVTRVGAFLRRYSLDEVPQVWNVLVGQMSLVGPRPIVSAEVDRYGRFFTYYTRVKPGMTGLWQVSGRSLLSYPERVGLDVFYAKNWSIWLDLKILSRTILSVVNSDGAF